MFSKKYNLAVVLTTFNHEMLTISVPAISKLNNNFLLVIYNDNPNQKLSKQSIKELGYKGSLVIINSDTNHGALQAKLYAVEELKKLRKIPAWVVFVDDDDMLISADLPSVADNNFAIIQNSLVVRNSLTDLLRLTKNPTEFVADNENLILDKPSINFTGTFIKTDLLFGMANIAFTIIEDLQAIESSLEYRTPVEPVLWSWLNLYVKAYDSTGLPIYMDKVNYIRNCLDSCKIKYGKLSVPEKHIEAHYSKTIKRFEDLFSKALANALRG